MVEGMFRGVWLRAAGERPMRLLERSVDMLAGTRTGSELLERGASSRYSVSAYPSEQWGAIEQALGRPAGTTEALHRFGDIFIDARFLREPRRGAALVGHELTHRLNMVQSVSGKLARSADEADAYFNEARIAKELRIRHPHPELTRGRGVTREVIAERYERMFGT